MLSPQSGELAAVLRGSRVGELSLYCGGALDGVYESVAEAQAGFPAYF